MNSLGVFRDIKNNFRLILGLVIGLAAIGLVGTSLSTAIADESPSDSQNIIINEIKPGTGGSEKWIELYNPTGDSINIKGWRFVRGNTTLSPVISSSADLILNPGDFYLYSVSGSLPIDGGANPQVKLLDGPSGNIIDSVDYGVSLDGQSYARFLNNSWQITDTPTPGSANVLSDQTAPIWNQENVHLWPENDAVISEDSEIIMQWSAASDPSGVEYYYLVSGVSGETSGDDNRLTNPIPWLFGPFNEPNHNATGTWPGTYYWQVKACDNLDNCTPWTEPSKGTVEAAELPI